jgi:hypothetical protein
MILISKAIVKKHNLPIVTYPKPYSLGSLSKNKHLYIQHKCKVKFAVINKVESKVVLLDVCDVILAILMGSPCNLLTTKEPIQIGNVNIFGVTTEDILVYLS